MKRHFSRQKILKALFVTSTVLGFLVGLAALALHFLSLPDLSKLLPKDETLAFYIVDREPAVGYLSAVTPLATEVWVKRIGWAQVNDTILWFAQVNSSEAAQNYLKTKLPEGQQWISERPTHSLWSSVSCSNDESTCFTWIGDILILSDSRESLNAVQKVAAGEAPNLGESNNYQNLRNRLSAAQSGFLYVDIQKALPHFSEDFEVLSRLIALYPVFGATFTRNDGHWDSESFVAIDKSLIQNQPYWHSTEKFEAKLLPWTAEDQAIEWSGRDLGAQLLQMETVLSQIKPGFEWQLKEDLENRWEKIFGPEVNVLSDFLPMLTGESYFGFTPEQDFLFLTELESEEDVQTVLSLKENFANAHRAEIRFTTPSGELQARFVPMEQSTGSHNNYQYYSFTAEGEELATVIVTEHLLIVAQKQSTAFATLDRFLGLTEPRSLDTVDTLLTGSNEFMSLHCLLLPDGSILKALLKNLDTVVLSRKIFDDGSFARSRITP